LPFSGNRIESQARRALLRPACICFSPARSANKEPNYEGAARRAAYDPNGANMSKEVLSERPMKRSVRRELLRIESMLEVIRCTDCNLAVAAAVCAAARRRLDDLLASLIAWAKVTTHHDRLPDQPTVEEQ